MDNASLVIVGSGIKFLSHLTVEAQAYIKQSNKVLYLVNDPILKEWIKSFNSSSESLDDLYHKHPLRINCYKEITEYILYELRKNQHVCVVFYGHPNVFAMPGLNAALQAKQEGFYTKILPGISAEACLYSDLMIDPGSCGCQSYEATDFLIHRKKFDTSSHLILWEIDAIGIKYNPPASKNEKGIKFLIKYLQQYYGLEHQVILYEAAQYPGFEPRIETITLGQLHTATISRITTLYIPPIKKSSNKKVVAEVIDI